MMPGDFTQSSNIGSREVKWNPQDDLAALEAFKSVNSKNLKV